MLHYTLLFLTLIFMLSSTVHAETFTLRKFTVTSVPNDGKARMFLYDSGTMRVLASKGVPETRGTYKDWTLGHDFSTDGINNVLPDSDFAAISYNSLSRSETIMRLFYQTTSGNIRSTLYNGTAWSLDPTVITIGAPLGAPISAFRDHDDTHEVIVVQYFDSNSVLTQRTETMDTANWGNPAAVTLDE